jgi:hypothetical protein
MRALWMPDKPRAWCASRAHREPRLAPGPRQTRLPARHAESTSLPTRGNRALRVTGAHSGATAAPDLHPRVPQRAGRPSTAEPVGGLTSGQAARGGLGFAFEKGSAAGDRSHLRRQDRRWRRPAHRRIQEAALCLLFCEVQARIRAGGGAHPHARDGPRRGPVHAGQDPVGARLNVMDSVSAIEYPILKRCLARAGPSV